jgi:hypothetical protein
MWEVDGVILDGPWLRCISTLRHIKQFFFSHNVIQNIVNVTRRAEATQVKDMVGTASWKAPLEIPLATNCASF